MPAATAASIASRALRSRRARFRPFLSVRPSSTLLSIPSASSSTSSPFIASNHTLRRHLATLPHPKTPTGSLVLRPTPLLAVEPQRLIPPPVPGSGPLLERRSDRQLPRYEPWWAVWAKTLPLFVALIAVSALGIFNYQKLSSSTVASILYALRTNDEVRAALGDQIYFRDRVPWVAGTLNQIRGVIDIGFGVKGRRGRGYVRFRSYRKERMGAYETVEWSLTLEDGRVLQLLEGGGAAGRPVLGAEAGAAVRVSSGTDPSAGDERLAMTRL